MGKQDDELLGKAFLRNSRTIMSATKRLGIEPLENRHMLAGDMVAELTDAEVEQKIETFKSYFDDVIEAQHSNFLNLAVKSGTDGVRLYNLQFAVDGILSMYEATGDRATLDRAILYTDAVMESAQVIEGGFFERDGYLDWEALSGGRPQAKRWGNMLNDFQFGSAMSRLARIIHEDLRLQGDEEVQKFGHTLIEFVDEQIVFKWLDARSQRDWLESFYDRGYWTDKATHIITICHNVTSILGDASSCGGIELSLGQQFKDLLVVEDDGAYVWSVFDAHPSGSHHPAPDTNHENRVATMISRLGVDDVVFDQIDIERLGATFTERIWNGRTDWDNNPGIQDSPWFHNYIDGSDEAFRGYVHYLQGTPGMNGFVYDGWIRLGEFVPEVQQAGEALLSFIQGVGSSVNAIRSRNGTSYGKISLTGHLARNLRMAYADSGPVSAQSVVSTDTLDGAKQKRVPGDADLDGTVGFSDFLVLSRNFGGDGRTWHDGDFDGDAAVTMTDFLILAANFVG